MTTEGIIQKAFTKMYHEYLKDQNSSMADLVNKTEQELIVEIRKELNVTDSRLPTWYNQLMRHKLIGDNQEYDDKLSEDDFED